MYRLMNEAVLVGEPFIHLPVNTSSLSTNIEWLLWLSSSISSIINPQFHSQSAAYRVSLRYSRHLGHYLVPATVASRLHSSRIEHHHSPHPHTMATSTLRSPALRQLFTPATTTRTARTLFAPRFQLQRAQFQTSARRNILPPLPQVIRGGVNDPAPVPESHPSHGSYHWSMERAVSAALIPLTVVPFAAGSMHPILDGGLIGLIIIHSYIGFQYVQNLS